METLGKLEKKSKELEISASEFEGYFREIAEFTTDFLDSLASERVYFTKDHLSRLKTALPRTGESIKEILDEFKSSVMQSGLNPASGRYFGYIPGGGVLGSALGDFLAALTNKYSGVFQACPAAAEIENLCIRWLIDMIGYPGTAWGTLQSGGSLATLAAIIAARNLRPWEMWPRSPVYLTSQTHLAIEKSLHVAGLGCVPKRIVPVTSDFRMDVAAFRQLVLEDRKTGLNPWIVFSSAGTTNTGAIDPLREISEICLAHDLWFHVDAAYGGFFTLAASGKEKLQGLEAADSIVLDPHKGLFLSYGCGAVLVKNGQELRKAFTYNSDYLADLHDSEKLSPADFSPELTRHFRGLRLWLSLKLFGIEAFSAALEEKLQLARFAYEEISKNSLIEVGPKPQLSCLTFRMRSPKGSAEESDQLTARLLQEILHKGLVHLSSTRLNGDLFLRLCILSFRSHFAEVKTALTEISAFTDLLGSDQKKAAQSSSGKSSLIRRHAAAVVCVKDQKILTVKLEDPTTKVQRLYLPGGKIEVGESPEQTAIRETLEETGYLVCLKSGVPKNLSYHSEWDGRTYDRLTHVYRAEVISLISQNIQDAPYHRGVVWLPLDKVQAEFTYIELLAQSIIEILRAAPSE